MRKLLMLAIGLFLFSSAWATNSSAVVVDSASIVGDFDSLLVCQGTSIELSSTPADSYLWTPSEDFDVDTLQTVTLTPSLSQWYFLTANVGGVDCRDSVYVSLIDPSFEVIVSTTDTICPETRVDVTFDASHPVTSVSWNPESGVTDPDNVLGSSVYPSQTTEYIVTATIGNCEVADTFTIEVIPFSLRLLTNDTIFLCKPEDSTLSVIVTPGFLDITWTPLDGFIVPDAQGLTAFVNPEVTTNYTASASYMGCDLERTTHVHVDSLPELAPLTILFPKDPYCYNDSIWVIGPSVDTSLYPDLTWNWTPMDGQIVGPGDSPGTTGNVRIILTDTTMFVRYANNNACQDTSSISVNVIPPEIPLSVNDTSLCPGETFIVAVLDVSVQDLEWSPAEGLSCTECFTPIVTAGFQSVMYMVEGTKEGCPVSASLNVTVLPPTPIPFAPNPLVGCPGDEIQMSIDDTGLTNLFISISGDGTISCTNCNDPIVTINGPGTILITADQIDSTAGCGAMSNIPFDLAVPYFDLDNSDTICPNTPVMLDLTGYGFVNPVVDLMGLGECTGDCLMPVVQITENGGSIMITSDNSPPGYCTTITIIELIAIDLMGGEIISQDSFPGRGETITVEVTPPGAPGTKYEWYVDGVLQNDDGNPAMVTFPTGNSAETSTVSVIWTNEDGCIEMVERVFTLVAPDIKFPNAITPGAGSNERFFPYVTGPAVMENLIVANRWGQVVYEGADPQGWDGTFGGKDAPPEVYVYLATFRYPNGDKEEHKGDVTLVR